MGQAARCTLAASVACDDAKACTAPRARQLWWLCAWQVSRQAVGKASALGEGVAGRHSLQCSKQVC